MMFADSAKLLFKTDGVKDLQVDLVCLSSWVEAMNLQFNTTKWQKIHVAKPQALSSPCYLAMG